ncbi:uncharacterized protein LOC119674473 [Teleopsis dalmanni]|uniref:uncharacterized protein LOC119674473 n=1 Tax=Teleopsis dalmanni TaxID=139649 RepID=UPI0018CEDE8F|nr:uncharacterized protein LOC119674473 [Teleopsis dalmanni]
MSFHSRSSSEIEVIQYRDVLPVFIKDFFMDFNFADVKHKFKIKNLFTESDFISLTEDLRKSPKQQILQLFHILCSNENLIPDFLDLIEYEYKWLVDKIKYERNTPSKETSHYIDVSKSLRSRYQNHTEFNVLRIEPYTKLRNALRQLQPHHKVVLVGEYGLGKKWLALDVCYEYTVLQSMNFKIFRFDVSKCNSPEEDLRVLQEFYIVLENTNYVKSYDSISNHILDLQQRIRQKLTRNEYKNCLIILENVQNAKSYQAFNLGCKMLIITRYNAVSDSLSSKMNRIIDMERRLTQNEFFCLFEKYLNRNRREFPSNATDIYEHCKCHPYLLSIVAKNMRQKYFDWAYWIRKLKCNGFSSELTAVKWSFDVLSEQNLNLYETFLIFQQKTSIPIKLLAALWDKTETESEDIIQTFHKFSLVHKEGKEITIPYIYNLYLKQNVKDLNELDLHRKIIDYYEVDKILNRNDIDFCDIKHDKYFFENIGYHIHEAKRHDLFQIYFDFKFLEQIIRTVDLAYTIALLKCYENEIINLDNRKEQLLHELYAFLPKIEERLTASAYTCLLQYALMANGAIRESALRQVELYPNRTWFTENGFFHQQRQIVNLPNEAKMVHILKHYEPDICIVVCENNILLLDVSLECLTGPISLTNDDNNHSPIIEARLFRKDEFLLTLNRNGELLLWSIADDRRRAFRRPSTKQKINPIKCKQITRQRNLCKQNIRDIPIYINGKIVAFDVEVGASTDNINLHVACDSGDIYFFKWNAYDKEFEYGKRPILRTNIRDIRSFCILKKYYMLLNASNKISFWNLKDSSNEDEPFYWPVQDTKLVCYQIYQDDGYSNIIFVFENKILLLSFKNEHNFLLKNAMLNEIYTYNEYNSYITCAKISPDNKYLVLGTKRGLIVLNITFQLERFESNISEIIPCEMFRRNVSETISCVDIYASNDRIYKYVIICGSKNKNALNLFALRQNLKGSLEWDHVDTQDNSDQYNTLQLEADVYLRGRRLFDITNEDGTVLLAVDSKNRVHQIPTSSTKNWSVILPSISSYSITAITAVKQKIFIGHENGAIQDLSSETYETIFNQAVSYLQLVTENILVASSVKEDKTYVKCLLSEIVKYLDSDTKISFMILERFLLLVHKNGVITILDAANDFIPISFQGICYLDDIYTYESGSIYLNGPSDPSKPGVSSTSKLRD